MGYRNIVVHVDASQACGARVETAVEFAARFGGRLSGHYARQQLSAIAFADAGGAAMVYQQVLDDIQAEFESVRTAFGAVVAAARVPTTWAPDDRPLFEGFIAAARYCDVALIGQHVPGDPKCMSAGLAAEVAIGAGIPVLSLPPGGPWKDIGLRPVIAWNDSRQSSRAVRDALPLLVRAGEVHAVTVDGTVSGIEKLQAALAGHEVEVRTHVLDSDEQPTGSRLLAAVRDLDADLLIAGAYGHSRVRELVLGGVTRSLLTEASLPVFLSH